MKKPCIMKHLYNLSNCFQLAVFNHHPAVEPPGHDPWSSREKVTAKAFNFDSFLWSFALLSTVSYLISFPRIFFPGTERMWE